MKDNKDQLTIVISHRVGFLDIEAFMDAVRGHFEALLGITRASAQRTKKSNVDWFVIDASMNSPFHMTVMPKTTKGSAIVGHYIKGLKKLDKLSVRPKYFSNTVIAGTKKLAESLDEGVDAIYLKSKKYGEFIVTKKILENISKIDLDYDEYTEGINAPVCKRHKERVSLRGKLEDLITHNKSYFRLYDELTGKYTKCFFRRGGIDLEQVKKCLPRRVYVSGIANYDESGFPDTMIAESMKIIEDRQGRKVEELKINITGDMDSVDYVRRIRNGETNPE